MATIVINGVRYEADGPITVINGEVRAGGNVVVTGLTGPKVNVAWEGPLTSLACDGSAEIVGDVRGNVEAGNGVRCGNVGGDVDAGNGVNCGDVRGSVDAGNSVTCGNVGGDVDAGGNISMRR